MDEVTCSCPRWNFDFVRICVFAPKLDLNIIQDPRGALGEVNKSMNWMAYSHKSDHQSLIGPLKDELRVGDHHPVNLCMNF